MNDMCVFKKHGDLRVRNGVHGRSNRPVDPVITHDGDGCSPMGATP